MGDRLLIISTYDGGHPPLLAAAAAGEAKRSGLSPTILDLSLDVWTDEIAADRVVIAAPMHLSLRLGRDAALRLRDRRPHRPIAFLGDQAWLARDALAGLAGLADHVALDVASLGAWLGLGERFGPSGPPDRTDIADLTRYARFEISGEQRLAATIETTHGCKHRCRHCPIPAAGRTRVEPIPLEWVLADARALVDSGARHLRLADADALNLPGHLMTVLERLRREWPELGFGITAKVSHLIRHRDLLPRLAELGVELVVTAVESMSDTVLARLDKGHDRADIESLPALLAGAGLPFRPTFVPFTPWTEADDLLALADWIDRFDLVASIDPVQLSLRLLVPPGSALLAHGDFDAVGEDSLLHRWRHPVSRLDRLQAELEDLAATTVGADPASVTARLLDHLRTELGRPRRPATPAHHAPTPRYTEPWFC